MKVEYTVLVAGLLIAGNWSARAQWSQLVQNQPPVAITIRAVKDVIQPGVPVQVQAIIRNDSNTRVPYDMAGWNEYHAFDVRDGAGNQPLTRRGRAMLMGEGANSDDMEEGGGPVGFVEPGTTLTVTVQVPTRVFDLTNPGRYTIQFRLPWRDGSLIKSNTTTVTVVEGPVPYVPPVPQLPISVTIHPAGGVSVFPGGKVAIEVITKNISNHWINERSASDKRDQQRFLRVDVQDSQGGTPPETDFGQLVGNRSDAAYNPRGPHATPGREDMIGLHYDLGQERTQIVNVNDLYDLSKPGQYTIQVRRWDDETKIWVKSNAITVTVTP